MFAMSEPVRVRRLTDEEGRRLQRLVRRGEGKGKASVVRYRRGLVILASAGGNTVPVIAKLVQTSPDRVREVIHKFNDMGLACLDPKWAGGRPRQITSTDEGFIVETAKTRPEKLGQPFTHWSIRKLARFLADNSTRRVTIGRERLRQILERHQITLPADQDLEGVQRSLARRQAGSDRGGDDQLPRALLRLRRVRSTRRASH